MTLPDIPLRISASTVSTKSNKTGFWRYVRPCFVQKTAPCSAACPAGEDVARVAKLVDQGFYKRALECILVENPFPAVCGRVCFHPCEGACNRAEMDAAVSVRCMERFLGDGGAFGRLEPGVFRFPAKGKTIAVVGAGPAGLSAAYFLTLLGYACTVFESRSAAGGVLRWGIPAYRLPADVLESEIDRIRRFGVDIRCSTPMSEPMLSEMAGEYDGIFLGCGHGRSLSMGIPGEAHGLDGLALLSDVKHGIMPAVKGPAAIIGGGNTAVDVARTLVRLGIDATLVYRRRRQDMPAYGREVLQAEKEGVSLVELSAAVRIEKSGEGLRLHLQRMKTSGAAPEGRARVVPDDAPMETMAVKSVVMAIGARADESWGFPPVGDGTAVLSHCTAVGEKPVRVYGGDLVNREKTVAHAVASGKQAAMVLDMMLSDPAADPAADIRKYQVGGGPSVSMEIYIGGERRTRKPDVVAYADINTAYFDVTPRMAPALLLPRDLKGPDAFSEVEQALPETSVRVAAGRCFNCGICNGCGNCRLFCPEMAVVMDAAGSDRKILMDYCKGCGICVSECPRNAMALSEEQA